MRAIQNVMTNNREDCRSSLAVFATIPVSCPELTKACKVNQPRIIAMPNLITYNFYDLKKPQTDKLGKQI